MLEPQFENIISDELISERKSQDSFYTTSKSPELPPFSASTNPYQSPKSVVEVSKETVQPAFEAVSTVKAYRGNRRHAALTHILSHTWRPKNGILTTSPPYNPVEQQFKLANQKRLGTAVHQSFADWLRGKELIPYAQRVQSMIQAVAAEGFLSWIEAPPKVELPLVWRSLDSKLGFTTRLDALAQIGGLPTLIEVTYREAIALSLYDVGGDKLAQIAGMSAACRQAGLPIQQVLVIIVYPFGRPDFFWIRDLNPLREIWKSNLLPRLKDYYS